MAKDGKDLTKWRCATGFLILLSLGLLIAVIVLAVQNSDLRNASETDKAAAVKVVNSDEISTDADGTVSKPPPFTASVFSGLSADEYVEFTNLLLTDASLNLTAASQATTQNNYIHAIEDYLPNKADVIDHLDNGTPRPPRMALAILFMNAEDPPIMAEYLIESVSGPIRRLQTHPWNSRPVDGIEEREVKEAIDDELQTIDYIAQDSFNTSLVIDCVDKCNMVYYVSRAQEGSDDRFIYPLSFGSPDRVLDAFLHYSNIVPIIKVTRALRQVSIEAVFYNGKRHDSVQSLKSAYDSGTIEKIAIWNNTAEYYKTNYGSPIRRGENLNPEGHRPPFQVYPDGQRFTVDGTHVNYLGWSFDVHTRTIAGMELMDVQFKSERIAYSLGIQDIHVIYGGVPPDNYIRNFWDAAWMIGLNSLSLTRGIDCPQNAAYLDVRQYIPNMDGESAVIKDGICVFEHLNAVPLRRHLDPAWVDGLPDSVLIVRQITTIGNYDYIFDYEFHQNGVIETRASSTGYIQVNSAVDRSRIDYGYLLDRMSHSIGIIHTHIFNFRADIDIHGRENQFSKIHYLSKTSTNPIDSSQTGSLSFSEETVRDETAAATEFNFNKPKHYVIRNAQAQNTQGNPRGYKISSGNFVKMVVPWNDTRLNGIKWAQKQLYVTKFKETERSTVSMATNGNPHNPSIDFDDFVNGENIVDEDLVTWVTVGMQHIPVSEDIPVTTTPGKQLVVTLAPFNYFDECPSISSCDGDLFIRGERVENECLKKDGGQCYTHPPAPVRN